MSDSDQEHLMEVTGPSARSLDILARALHVKNAELQPTLEAIVSTAVRMLSPALHAGLTVFSRGEFTPPGLHRRGAAAAGPPPARTRGRPLHQCRQAPVHLPDPGH